MGNCGLCGRESELCCSDCGIEQRGQVYVCDHAVCRDTHEKLVHGPKWSKFDVHTGSMSTKPKNLICPVCGHTDREPQQAGNPCPKCEALPGMGVLESIDPDILKALLPFAPEEQQPKDNGSIWLYDKLTVALPATSTFSVLMKFGEGGAPKGVPEVPPDTQIRVKLLGFYKNEIL